MRKAAVDVHLYAHFRHPHTLSAYTHIPHKQQYTSHRPSSKIERNPIILQVNINGIKTKLEELKLLIYNTYADIITIQETKHTHKANTPKVHNFTTVRSTDRLHKGRGGLITLIRDKITFTTTDIHSTINTHNTEIVKHITNIPHSVLPGMRTHTLLSGTRALMTTVDN